MEISIWWDYENDSEKPWSFSITYLNETTEGCRSSMHECWQVADAFIYALSVKQDNSPQCRRELH
jgi:hypothetical protein